MVSEISKEKIIDFRCLFYLEDTLATNPHNTNYKVQYSEDTLATNPHNRNYKMQYSFVCEIPACQLVRSSCNQYD